MAYRFGDGADLRKNRHEIVRLINERYEIVRRLAKVMIGDGENMPDEFFKHDDTLSIIFNPAGSSALPS